MNTVLVVIAVNHWPFADDGWLDAEGSYTTQTRSHVNKIYDPPTPTPQTQFKINNHMQILRFHKQDAVGRAN